MLFIAFEFYGKTELFENVVCSDSSRVIFESNESYELIEKRYVNEDCAILEIHEYFETLQSSDEFYFGHITVQIEDAVKRILNNKGMIERYIKDLDFKIDCISSQLQYLINSEIKEMVKEEIDKMENMFFELEECTMKWN